MGFNSGFKGLITSWCTYSGGLEYESWVQSGYTEISLRLPLYHQTIPRTCFNRRNLLVWISAALGWLQDSTAVFQECYTALMVSKLPSFRDNISVPSSGSSSPNFLKRLPLQFKDCKSVHHHTIQINHQLDAKISPVYYPDVYLQLNMFRASSRPSSEAQQLR